MRTDETVREVCEEISYYGEDCQYFDKDGFLNLKPLADRILADYERELSANDAEIARLKAELNAKKNRISGLVTDVQNKNGHICDKQFETLRLEKRISLLERALKPVMECQIENKMCRAISVKSDDDEMDARLKVSVWIDMSNAVSAVREAQRVMLESSNG